MWPRRNRHPQPQPDARSLSFDWLDSCFPWDCFRNFRRGNWWCVGRNRNSDRRCCDIFGVCCDRPVVTSQGSAEGTPAENNPGLDWICPLSQRGTDIVNRDDTVSQVNTPNQTHGHFCFGRLKRNYAVEGKRYKSFNGQYSKLIPSPTHISPTFGDNSSQRCLNPLALPADRGNFDRIKFLSSSSRNVLRNHSKTDDSDSVVFFQGCCGYATFSTDCCTGHPYLSRCQSLSDSLLSSKRDYDIVFFRGKCGYASFDSNCCRLLQTMHYNMRLDTTVSSDNDTELQCNWIESPDRSARICPEDINMSTPSDESEEAVDVPVFKSQLSSQSLPEILILSCEEGQSSSTTTPSRKRKSLKRSKTTISVKKSTLTPIGQSIVCQKSFLSENLQKSDLTRAKVPKKDKVKLKVIEDTVDIQSTSSETMTSASRKCDVSECGANTGDVSGPNTNHDTEAGMLASNARESLSETDVQNVAAQISYKAINAAIVVCENSENTESCQRSPTVETSQENDLVYLHLTLTPTFEYDSASMKTIQDTENKGDLSSPQMVTNTDTLINNTVIKTDEPRDTESCGGGIRSCLDSTSGTKSPDNDSRQSTETRIQSKDDFKLGNKDKSSKNLKQVCKSTLSCNMIASAFDKRRGKRTKDPHTVNTDAHDLKSNDTGEMKAWTTMKVCKDVNDKGVTPIAITSQPGLVTQESGSFEVLSDPNLFFMCDGDKNVKRFTFDETFAASENPRFQHDPAKHPAAEGPIYKDEEDAFKSRECNSLQKDNKTEYSDLKNKTEVCHNSDSYRKVTISSATKSDVLPDTIQIETVQDSKESKQFQAGNTSNVIQNMLPSNTQVSLSITADTRESLRSDNDVNSAQEQKQCTSNQPSSSFTKQANLSQVSGVSIMSESKHTSSNAIIKTPSDKRQNELTEDKAINDTFDSSQQLVKSEQTSSYDPRVDILVAETIVKAVSDLHLQVPAFQTQSNTTSDNDMIERNEISTDSPDNNDGQEIPNYNKQTEEYSIESNIVLDLNSEGINKTTSDRNGQLAMSHRNDYDNEMCTTGQVPETVSFTDNTPHELTTDSEDHLNETDEMSVDSLEMPNRHIIPQERIISHVTQRNIDQKSLTGVSSTTDNSSLFMTNSISNPTTSESNGKPLCIASIPDPSRAGYTCLTQTTQINTMREPLFSVISHEGNILSAADDIGWMTVPGPALTSYRQADSHQAINKHSENERYSGSRQQHCVPFSQIPEQNFVSFRDSFVSDSVNSDLSERYQHDINAVPKWGTVITSDGSDNPSKKGNDTADIYRQPSVAQSVTSQPKRIAELDYTGRFCNDDQERTNGNSLWIRGDNEERKDGPVSISERLNSNNNSETAPRGSDNSPHGSVNCTELLKQPDETDQREHVNLSDHDRSEHGDVQHINRNIDILTIERIDFSEEAELFAKQLLGQSENNDYSTDNQQKSKSLDVYLLSVENSAVCSSSGNVVSLPYGARPLVQNLQNTDNTVCKLLSTQDNSAADKGDVSSFDCRTIAETNEGFSDDTVRETLSPQLSLLTPCGQSFESSLSFEIAEGIVNGQEKGDNCDSSCVSDYIREYNELCKSSLENERRILRSVLESVRGCYSPNSSPEQPLPALHVLPSNHRHSIQTHKEDPNNSLILKYRSDEGYRGDKTVATGRFVFSDAAGKEQNRENTIGHHKEENHFPLFRTITEETDEQLRAEGVDWLDRGVVFSDPKQTPDKYQKRLQRRPLLKQKRIDDTGSKWTEPSKQKTKVVNRRKLQAKTQCDNYENSIHGQEHARGFSAGAITVNQGSVILNRIHTKPRTQQNHPDRTQNTDLYQNKHKPLKRQNSKRSGPCCTLKGSQSVDLKQDVISKGIKRESGDIVVIQKRRNEQGGIVKEEKYLKTKRKVTSQEGSRKRYKTCVLSGICDVPECTNNDQGQVTGDKQDSRSGTSRITSEAGNIEAKSDNVNTVEIFYSNQPGTKAKRIRGKAMSRIKNTRDSNGERMRNKSDVKNRDRYEDDTADIRTPSSISEKHSQGTRYDEVSDADMNTASNRSEGITDDVHEKEGRYQARELSPGKLFEVDDQMNSDVDNRRGPRLADRYRKETNASDGEYVSMLAEGQLSFMQDLESWREAYNINADDIERDALKLLEGDLTNLYDDLSEGDKEEVTKEIENMNSMTHDDLMKSLRG